ncbi:MAG TPA: hypothetical protein VHE30_28315 [Polyangiaceae bacterium]|nr:hypothetical protein [Polyangiaceae bacterium]
MPKLAPLALVPLLVACNGDFDPASRVTDLRVLAVQADQPYAHPGETVNLSALAFDPAMRPITWGWAYCENPKDSSALGCLEALRERKAMGEDVRFTTGTDLSRFSLTVPDNALDGVVPGRSLLGVVAVACPGALDPEVQADVSDGDPLPVVCRDSAGNRLGSFDFVVGMKRVFVRNADRNENPPISGVTWDGADWPETLVPQVDACDKETNVVDDCASRFRHAIRVNAAANAVESGISETGEPFTEQVVVQYYATEGTYADDVRVWDRPETKWVARPSARGKDVTLWFVLRDDRGGVSWATRHVAVKP